MQTLKVEVRERIISSAKEAFFNNGYERASMRSIAKKSEITAGNIYRYFSGKDELFEAVIGDVYRAIAEIGEDSQGECQPVWSAEKGMDISRNDALKDIIALFVGHRKEIIILMQKAGGSKFESIASELRDLFVRKIHMEVFGHLSGVSVNLRILSEALTNACVDGIVQICASDMAEREVYRNIYGLLAYIFDDAQERLVKSIEKIEVK